MDFLSRAAHQPSSSRAILLSPRLLIVVYLSGTSVSLNSIASRRQQAAWQFAQVTLVSGRDATSLVIVSISLLTEAFVCFWSFCGVLFVGDSELDPSLDPDRDGSDAKEGDTDQDQSDRPTE